MAKIHVNLHQGIVDIEGDEEFVRSAFKEVQGVLSAFSDAPNPPAPESPLTGNHSKEVSEPKTSPTKPAAKSKKPSGKSKASVEKGGAGVSIDKYYSAQLDPSVDTAGLKEFYKKYNPTIAKTRNLVFAAFLRDQLAKNPCTANDIFSCYYAMKSDIKIPVAFGKSLMDSRADGYIAYTTANDISITILGENTLSELAKKAGE